MSPSIAWSNSREVATLTPFVFPNGYYWLMPHPSIALPPLSVSPDDPSTRAPPGECYGCSMAYEPAGFPPFNIAASKIVYQNGMLIELFGALENVRDA